MDLQWLRPIARAEGPFATVYLDASHHTPDASQLIELNWRRARTELVDAGADEITVTALDAAIGDLEAGVDGPPGPVGQVLVAAGGTVLLNVQLPHPPEQPSAHWAPAPHLLPALSQLPEPVATVVAVVDSTGAELYTEGHAERHDTGRYPLHQVRGGGMSHLKMRHRVEENERASAAEIAHAIGDAVSATHADLLVLAGETQSRSRVHRALERSAVRVTEEVDTGGRAPGADRDRLDHQVRALVEDRAAAIRRAEADHYASIAGGAGGGAVDGLEPVIEALRAAQVSTLYLDTERPPGERLWIGPEPDQLAARRDVLTSLGIPTNGPVEAADALLRAAAGTGAALYPVAGGHPELTDGVGAILRTGAAPEPV